MHSVVMAGKRPAVVQIALWLLLIVCIATNASFYSSSNSNNREENKVQSPCNERERQALLKFKHTLNTSFDTLTSWVGDDCCSWMGVGCHSKTGHVIKLNLSNALPYAIETSGEIDPSLLELKHLSYLDLSNNYFGFKPLPKFLDSFTKLRYLNLSYTHFAGKIPHQLGNLSSLHYLDLHQYYVEGDPFHDNYNLHVDNLQWLSHLSSLKYLDMGGVNLSMAADLLQAINLIPSLSELHLSECDLRNFPTLPHLNLTSLTVLDLSHNSFTLKSLHWLGNLSSLKCLDMESVNLSMAADWLQAINMIHSLSELHLSYCDLGNFPTVPHLNLTSLTVLDLSYNSFISKSLDWLANLPGLVSLDLSGIGLGGPSPSSISPTSESLGWLSQLPKLESLDLSDNRLEGPIPSPLWGLCNILNLDLSSNNLREDLNGFLKSLTACGANNLKKRGSFASMRELHLGSNNFSSNVPESLGQLSNLVHLDMSNNSFEGVISEAHFANLTRLESLDMSENSIAFNVSPHWIPPFQLKVIRLGSCQLGPQFPTWLQLLRKDDLRLDLSNSQVSDVIPNWFWNFSSQVSYISLSRNWIYGTIPSSLDFRQDAFIDFSSNLFKGSLPQNVSGASRLDLSNNSFSGPINMSIGTMFYLSLSNNHLYGSIPFSICGSNIQILDLSKNNLTGQIPLCLRDSSHLYILDLSYNNLNSAIPNIFGTNSLECLQLSHNNLSGVIPSSIRTTHFYFLFLDLSENMLSGSIPKWIGKSLPQLQFLNLRSNMFVGSIPPQLSLLSSLQFLDLAHNRLSGKIPSSFYIFTSMQQIRRDLWWFGYYGGHEMVTMKGNEMNYTKTFSLLTIMDLSRNSLSGEIPKELTTLSGLQSLNLSGNQLEGRIPQNIGSLRQLQSLDLSQNHFSGTIPSSISALTFLSSLNLSNNNLSGRIPSGNQLQTLIDPSIYAGNYDLCGQPLPKLCPGDEATQAPNTVRGEDEKDGLGQWWLYIGVAIGFMSGFWLVCGILIFNKSWRIAYYRFFDRLNEKLSGFYVNILVKVMMKLKCSSHSFPK